MHVRASGAEWQSSEPGAAVRCSLTQNPFCAAAARPLGREFGVSLLAAAAEDLQMKSSAAEQRGWSGKEHAVDLPGPTELASCLLPLSTRLMQGARRKCLGRNKHVLHPSGNPSSLC